MGKIICLMGKSSTGKDTIYKALLQSETLSVRHIVPYTTRPIRIKETDGVEYRFTDEEGFQALLARGLVIEHRSYRTYHGLWRYFTVDDGQIDLKRDSYLCIGTLESYNSMKRYFGETCLVPVLIELDDGVRLERALERERKQARPQYEEMCRRFLADSEDFSEEKIREAGVTRRFYNGDLGGCLLEIQGYIKERLEK